MKDRRIPLSSVDPTRCTSQNILPMNNGPGTLAQSHESEIQLGSIHSYCPYNAVLLIDNNHVLGIGIMKISQKNDEIWNR